MQIKGLDVSEFQGNVDWEKVKAAGYQFAMLRAGYGFNTIDPQFKRNASECNRIGLPRLHARKLMAVSKQSPVIVSIILYATILNRHL